MAACGLHWNLSHPTHISATLDSGQVTKDMAVSPPVEPNATLPSAEVRVPFPSLRRLHPNVLAALPETLLAPVSHATPRKVFLGGKFSCEMGVFLSGK